MNRSEQPVMASGPSSVLLMLLTKSWRLLFSHELLFRKPEGTAPRLFADRNWAARKRDSPSPWLPSVFWPYQPRPCARMNCSVISATSR